MFGLKESLSAARWRWLALLLTAVLAASACGGGDGDGAGRGGAAEATPAVGGDGAQPSTGADSGQGEDAPEGAPAPEPEAVDAPEAALEPQYGGTLVVGLEAETASGLNPVTAQAAVSGHILFRALYDTLTIEGADGEMLPNLLESFSSNDDFTEWTLTLRPGINFHDGTPADSAALKRHFEEQVKGTLTGILISDWEIQAIETVDDLSVKLVLGRPYASLPAFLSSHLGYLGAPAMHDMGPQGAARNPIGTGPFILQEWIPGEVTRMTRNPGYWRTDAEGRQLPYLDALEFRPIPDSDSRFAALRSGDLDASSDNTGNRIDDYNEQFKTYWQEDRYSETSFLLLNNAKPPLDNEEFRRALAQCTDREKVSTLRWDGEAPATGPFSPGTPGYLADTGFPGYDPAAGRAAIARLGVTDLALGTTQDSANLLNTELLASMWSDCGLDVDITQVDQAELITNAVTGNFSAFFWRQHEGYDMSTERVWWHSKFGQGIALNFGRVDNPKIDAALDEVLATTDRNRLRELAEQVNRAFGESVHHIWFYDSNWLFATHDRVHGVDNLTLDDGAEHLKVFSGRVFLTEAWIGQ